MEFGIICGIIIPFYFSFCTILYKCYNKWNNEEENSEIWKIKNKYFSEIYNKYITSSIEMIYSNYFIYFTHNKYRFTPFYNFIKSISKKVNKLERMKPGSESIIDIRKEIKDEINGFEFIIGAGSLELKRKELMKLKKGTQKFFLIEKGLDLFKKLVYFNIFIFIIIIFLTIYNFINLTDSMIEFYIITFTFSFIFTLLLFSLLIYKYYYPFIKIIKNYDKKYQIGGIN